MTVQALVRGVLCCSWLILLVASIARADQAYTTVEFEGSQYHVVVAEPERIQLFWKDDEGNIYRQFKTLIRDLEAKSRIPAFLMNAGIFEPGGIPSGLLIIEHQQLLLLNLKEGEGNFYLKPNGVFFIERNQARVVTSEEYSSLKPQARIAIQAGPVLLREGVIHPVFRPGSKNHLHRNGVGIRGDAKVVFAITEFNQDQFPNFHTFARFFQSQGCRDALFLDGDISEFYAHGTGAPSDNNFGAIFGITEPMQK